MGEYGNYGKLTLHWERRENPLCEVCGSEMVYGEKIKIGNYETGIVCSKDPTHRELELIHDKSSCPKHTEWCWCFRGKK